MKKASIIIPTFNRAHLLGETLDSIVAQTYTHWECLVIDDGSTDNSQSLFDEYAQKDERVKFLKRPAHKPKGANACRNAGLREAQGEYIVFFDSDDLMTPNHLEVKIQALEAGNFDYSITRTRFFNKDSSQIDTYYTFDRYAITPFNYITQRVNWLTYDVCIKASLAKQIEFSERIQAGQEYNYFSKLVLLSTNAVFKDEVVTLRRHHDDSIRSGLKTEYLLEKSFFYTFWLTYLDIYKQADEQIQKFLIWRCVSLTMKHHGYFGTALLPFYIHLYRFYRISVLYHLMYIVSMKWFNKGYFLRSKFMRSINP